MAKKYSNSAGLGYEDKAVTRKSMATEETGMVVSVRGLVCKVAVTVIPRLTSDPANEFFG